MNVFDRALGKLDRARLAKVLSMMGSLRDGEVLAAARLAETLRSQSGNTWYELLGANPHRDDWHDLIIRCLDHPDLLTGWEIDYLHSLRGFTDPSTKQRAILNRIWGKVRVG
jgi:hypothetical protein